MKYFIPANKAPPIANVTAKDFQETGYWGRDVKTKTTSKRQTFNHTKQMTVVLNIKTEALIMFNVQNVSCYLG